MNTPPDADLKRYEEEKRERHWDPAVRWRVIQEMIAWADSQATGGRNTRQRCLELQREKDRLLATRDERPAAKPKTAGLPPQEAS
jgi:hypothetical protein